MKLCRPLGHTCLVVVLSILSAPMLGANTPVSVDVERGADKAYVVDAGFDVNVPASIAWGVLTDYEGIGRIVSSIRQTTMGAREITTTGSGTRVTCQLKANPNGGQRAA